MLRVLTLTLTLTLFTVLAAVPKPEKPSCINASSTSLWVQWASVGVSDLYYIALFSNETSLRPDAIITSTFSPARVEDLIPGTTYFIRLRAHPSSAPAVVAGWGGYSEIVVCKTSRLTIHQPHSLSRGDEPPMPTEIKVSWQRPSEGSCTQYTLEATLSDQLSSPVVARASNLTATTHILGGLAPGLSYFLRVICNTGCASDIVRFRTASAESEWFMAYVRSPLR